MSSPMKQINCAAALLLPLLLCASLCCHAAMSYQLSKPFTASRINFGMGKRELLTDGNNAVVDLDERSVDESPPVVGKRFKVYILRAGNSYIPIGMSFGSSGGNQVKTSTSVVREIRISPTTFNFGFGKRAILDLAAPEQSDWSEESKRLAAGNYAVGFGKRESEVLLMHPAAYDWMVSGGDQSKRLSAGRLAVGFGKRLSPAFVPVGFGKKMSMSNFGKRPSAHSMTLGFGKRSKAATMAFGFGKRPMAQNMALGFGKRPSAHSMALGFGKRPMAQNMALGFGKRPMAQNMALGFGK